MCHETRFCAGFTPVVHIQRPRECALDHADFTAYTWEHEALEHTLLFAQIRHVSPPKYLDHDISDVLSDECSSSKKILMHAHTINREAVFGMSLSYVDTNVLLSYTSKTQFFTASFIRVPNKKTWLARRGMRAPFIPHETMSVTIRSRTSSKLPASHHVGLKPTTQSVEVTQQLARIFVRFKTKKTHLILDCL